jgi:hypothetical protein
VLDVGAYPGAMLSRRDAAIRLDIPLEMATKHGIPARMTSAEFDALVAEPPAWLAQSRANRTGKAVWTTLTCELCGFAETVRPKKWWPDFTHLICEEHDPDDLPQPALGLHRGEVEGIGSRFVAIVDMRA